MKKVLLTICLVGLLCGFTANAQGVSFQQIRRAAETKTKAQFKVYARSLEGRNVSWEGWVDDVDEKLFGGYKVLIDMDSPEELSVFDVYFDISESRAQSLRKNGKYRFTGRIKSIGYGLFGLSIHLENGRI